MTAADWAIVLAYLVGALSMGFWVRRDAAQSRESYFLAGRSIPWWWAGMSIAATTFAADTPLAITGIVAAKGLSGNWIWLSWIGVHGAVVVYFASRWSRSGVLTDAELISLRYSGPASRWLRLFRAGLYGLIYNGIILGWVLRAMVKIVTPFFYWDRWLGEHLGWLEALWPASSPLGSLSEALTIAVLVGVVAIYSSLGGLRGVIATDLLQLAIALAGSVWLAVAAWGAVGGRDALLAALTTRYGADHRYLQLFPSFEGGWLSAAGISGFAFGAYLIVQSFANVPADGGGYLMQRLNACEDAKSAQRASLLFVLLHYLLRIWPWFIVAIAALVLMPLGAETERYGQVAAAVAADRELAYPQLMAALLPPLGLGLMLTSLLAAFMSTVDTHINWGASYVVNDLLLELRPKATPATQVRVARFAVVGFALTALVVSTQIQTIEQAWQWVAALGAALGLPTALRWLWWRVNASAEIGAMVAGLLTALILALVGELRYEHRLIAIAAASIAGLLLGIAVGPATKREVIERFVATVRPVGSWPRGQGPALAAALPLWLPLLRWILLVGGVVGLLAVSHGLLFFGLSAGRLGGAMIAALALYGGGRGE